MVPQGARGLVAVHMQTWLFLQTTIYFLGSLFVLQSNLKLLQEQVGQLQKQCRSITAELEEAKVCLTLLSCNQCSNAF